MRSLRKYEGLSFDSRPTVNNILIDNNHFKTEQYKSPWLLNRQTPCKTMSKVQNFIACVIMRKKLNNNEKKLFIANCATNHFFFYAQCV